MSRPKRYTHQDARLAYKKKLDRQNELNKNKRSDQLEYRFSKKDPAVKICDCGRLYDCAPSRRFPLKRCTKCPLRPDYIFRKRMKKKGLVTYVEINPSLKNKAVDSHY